MHDRITLISAASFSAYRFSPLWKKSALAAAAALTLLGTHSSADALGLGAVQVQSFLGEPLRAEVEVPDITSEEAAALQVTLGTPQEFQAAGVDYSEALRGTRITLKRRSNGQAYLLVQGQRPVNEPFLGIVIDASWGNNGRVVRDYTLLIDPPRQRADTSATTPAQRGNAPVITGKPRRDGSGASGATAESGTAPGEGQSVQVQSGDTATSILEAHQVEGASLDQMLLALLRANPKAFIHGNVNLIRAGAVVNIPSANQATAVSPASARRLLIAQSHDFRAYRQGLAKTAAYGGGQAAAGRRSATGSVQPQVQEINAAPTPQDRLMLSRSKPGAGQTSGTERAETSAAQSRHAQEQASREAELRRNINELSQLTGTGGSAAAAAASSAAKPSVPAINIPASAAVAAVTTPATSARAAIEPTASTPATAAAPRSPAPLPLKPSFMDTLLDSWPMLAGVVVILLLLGGYALQRGRKTKNVRQPRIDSDLHLDSGSHFAPDSYFGADGGQRVDTRNAHSRGGAADAASSMNYSPSQLEAVGDIDPVSEADVYLAYGRDAQAEEILKEALRAYPGRASIYVKLAEIYAKQRDTRQLAAIATEARRVTHGEGHDWQAIVNLGHNLDPDNPLYTSSSTPATGNSSVTQPPGSSGADLDVQDGMDLNLAGTPPQAVPPQPTGGFSQTVLTSAPMPLGAAAPAATEPMRLPISQRAGTGSASSPSSSGDSLKFTPPAPPISPPQPRQAQPGNSGMMAFEPNKLSATPAARPAKAGAKPEDPLATKLALAQEFHAIGDDSSARDLVKEVIAEATGAMKTKAEKFLRDLG
jgi:pilus assembly protein FimV